MIHTLEVLGDLHLVQLKTRALGSDAGRYFNAQTLCASDGGPRAVLVDLSHVRRITHSGLALLLTVHQGPVDIAYHSLTPKVAAFIARAGFDDVLRLFPDPDAALSTPWARRHSLSGHRAVLLCAGKGSRCAPLSQDVPKPMFDILGKPVLERLMDHVSSFGVRDFILNPGHLGPQVHRHFGDGHRFGKRITYLNEGTHGVDGWSATPLGSASSLARLHHSHSAFERDTFVFCGDALFDIDLARMMQAHRDTNAWASVAARHVAPQDVSKYGIIETDEHGSVVTFQEKPSQQDARSRLANTGIYIFSPQALALLPDRPGQDIAFDLLPTILELGERIQVFSPQFSWSDIGCPRDYFATLTAALQERIGAPACGTLTNPAQWHAPSAQVSPLAELSGPVYVAPGAQVKAGARIIGPSVIGENAIIEGRTLIRNSAIMARTHVEEGAAVSDMIASGDWAISHQLADGSKVSSPPLEFVTSLDHRSTPSAQAKTLREPAPFAAPMLRAVS